MGEGDKMSQVKMLVDPLVDRPCLTLPHSHCPTATGLTPLKKHVTSKRSGKEG